MYNAARPGYPIEALKWAFGDKPCDVADIGAGTGLLTRGLIDAGHRATAVEPDAKMLETLAASTPGLVDGLLGPAEALPLPDAGFDYVTAGQAYHWFEPRKALPEIVRVLRPGGRFVPIWNLRDEEVDWVAALTEIIGFSDAEIVATKAVSPGFFGPWFQEPEVKIFQHEKPLTADSLVELVKSRSYYITADENRKQQLRREVRELVSDHPALAGKTDFAMPYKVHAFRLAPA